MKKLTLAAAILGLAGLSAFAQSSVQFAATGSPSTTKLIWDDWSSLPALRADASNNVAFLWSTTGTPLVDSVAGATQSATNGSTAFLNTQAGNTAAWNAILTDPNFHLATNGSVTAIAQSSGVGNYSYNSGNAFTLAGTPTGTVTIYVIAWSYLYANPFLAAAGNAPVGWSNPFSYTLGTPSVAAQAFNVATTLDNLRVGVTPIVPEPTTLALLGLGSASLMIFRRRNS